MASNNIGIKINLQALQGAFLKNLTGKTATKRCLIIPVDDNPAMARSEYPSSRPMLSCLPTSKLALRSAPPSTCSTCSTKTPSASTCPSQAVPSF